MTAKRDDNLALTGHFELFFVLMAAIMGALLAIAGRAVHSAYQKRVSSNDG